MYKTRIEIYKTNVLIMVLYIHKGLISIRVDTSEYQKLL